jgi:hypothetical protein
VLYQPISSGIVVVGGKVEAGDREDTTTSGGAKLTTSTPNRIFEPLFVSYRTFGVECASPGLGSDEMVENTAWCVFMRWRLCPLSRKLQYLQAECKNTTHILFATPWFKRKHAHHNHRASHSRVVLLDLVNNQKHTSSFAEA